MDAGIQGFPLEHSSEQPYISEFSKSFWSADEDSQGPLDKCMHLVYDSTCQVALHFTSICILLLTILISCIRSFWFSMWLLKIEIKKTLHTFYFSLIGWSQDGDIYLVPTIADFCKLHILKLPPVSLQTHYGKKHKHFHTGKSNTPLTTKQDTHTHNNQPNLWGK